MAEELLGSLGGHAFLSYVREDVERVDRLADALTEAGIPVWRDTRDLQPGQDWKIEIRRAIDDGAFAFLACFSRHSETRAVSYQNEELILAVEQFRRRPPGASWLIPVRFDDCRLPDFDLGGGRRLTSLQQVDLFDGSWPMLGRLIMAITRILSNQPVASPAPAGPDRVADEDWSGSGMHALEQGRNRYALSLAENGIKGTDLPSADLQFVRGAALHRLGRSAEALEPLRLASEIDPDNEAIQAELVSALIESGDHRAAYKISAEVAGPPYRKSLLSGGLQEAQEAYRLWPDDLRVKGHFALQLAQLGTLRSAREAWRIAPDVPSIESAYLSRVSEAASPPKESRVAAEQIGVRSRRPSEVRLARKPFREVLEDFPKLSERGRLEVENLILKFVSRVVEEADRYEERRAASLSDLVASLASKNISPATATRIPAIRRSVFWSRRDGETAAVAFSLLSAASLAGFVFFGLFITPWLDAAIGTLIASALLGAAILWFTSPITVRARRRRGLERRHPGAAAHRDGGD